MPSSLWEKCLSHLEDELSVQQLNTWLRPLQAIETKDSLCLLAPNAYVQTWVQEQLEQRLNKLVANLTQDKISSVQVEVGNNIPDRVPTKATPDNNRSNTRNNKTEPALGSPMNPLFTFDTFVEGKSNQ
ncbi:MAG: DnaA N-terminal domain-containing protein, partial [Methylophagaceae bacterium]